MSVRYARPSTVSHGHYRQRSPAGQRRYHDYRSDSQADAAAAEAELRISAKRAYFGIRVYASVGRPRAAPQVEE